MSAGLVPSFKYVSDKERWPGEIFCPLLMRHGPPPPGVKWYGKAKRLHLTNLEAKEWEANIRADCTKAVGDATVISHYKPEWRRKHALNIKNLFIRWCRDERR